MVNKLNFDKSDILVITGVCGTVGQELLRQITLLEESQQPRKIIGLDNNESSLFFLEQKYRAQKWINLYFQDIRDQEGLDIRLRGATYVIHTAALKHVIISETSPYDAAMTNIVGLQNLIKAVQRVGSIKQFVFTSSDKAVNPTNVMGTTKLMGERLVTAANIEYAESKMIFYSVRFGNVLGSNGSVIQIFYEQIKNNKKLTLTDMAMTRFVMNVEQAAMLILDSMKIACGGEVFITKMPVLKISDLAKALLSYYGKDPENDSLMEIIGRKPGEKLYEELMTFEEINRSYDIGEYFAVLPALEQLYPTRGYEYIASHKKAEKNYISNEEVSMSRDEILDVISPILGSLE